ncbi:MAG: hypothetical protein ACYCOU_04870 [Sulfobacillus sp.]
MTDSTKRRWTGCAFVLAIIVPLAVGLKYRTHFLFVWDSVQFALAAINYEQFHHPYGYPLWVGCLRLLQSSLCGPNQVQILMADLFAAGAGAAIFYMTLTLYDLPAAAVALTFLIFSPINLLYSQVATTYEVNLLVSATVGMMSALLWRGNHRVAAPAGLIWAVCAGFRFDGAVLMLPLLAMSFVKARLPVRDLWRTLLLTIATVLIWLIPLWLSSRSGGEARTGHYYSQWLQIFMGQQDRFLTFAIWLMMSILPAIALWSPRDAVKVSSRPLQEYPVGVLFYVLWVAPAMALDLTLIGGSKPCYSLICLPPLAGLMASYVSRRLSVQRNSINNHVLIRCVGVALIGLTLAILPYPKLQKWHGLHFLWYPLHLASLGNAQESDQIMQSIVSVDAMAPDDPILVFNFNYSGPNWRKISWYLPRAPSYWLGGNMASIHRSATTVDDICLAVTVKGLWWVVPGRELPSLVRTEFPNTVRSYTDGRGVVSFWHTLSLPAVFAATLDCEGNAITLKREPAARRVSEGPPDSTDAVVSDESTEHGNRRH